MEAIDINQFLKDPVRPIIQALDGNTTTITMGDGHRVVVVDETEWTMLNQALKICTEHPEWTTTS